MGLRLFVCEYVTGGGLTGQPGQPLGQPLPASLCREGDMMLGALVKDLRDLPGVELVLTRDIRLAAPDGPADIRWLGHEDDPWALWRRIAEEVDAAWPIAPETDGMLERLSRLVLDSGCKLIGSHPDAVRLTASKIATTAHLSRFGLPVVPTRALSTARAIDLPPGPDGWVVKPDDGAGTEETHLFRRQEELEGWLDGGVEPGTFILQPYIPGEAASLSMLCRDGQARLLSCNRQHVRVENGRFSYRGGITGGLEHRRPVYERIAQAVAEAIPGLWGHVGVDLVESAAGPVLLEVNPRLTTSYVGLRATMGANPAALVLDLLEHGIDADQGFRKSASHEFAVGGEDAR